MPKQYISARLESRDRALRFLEDGRAGLKPGVYIETARLNSVPFATQLRDLLDSDGQNPHYRAAAPQCPFPDAAQNAMMNGTVAFDALSVQFYNNYCGVSSFQAQFYGEPNVFNLDVWQDWASLASQRILLYIQ